MREPYLREVQWGVRMVVSMAFAGLLYWMVCQFILVLKCLPVTKGIFHS